MCDLQNHSPMFMHIIGARASIDEIGTRCGALRMRVVSRAYIIEHKELTATGLKLEYDRAFALGFAILVFVAS